MTHTNISNDHFHLMAMLRHNPLSIYYGAMNEILPEETRLALIKSTSLEVTFAIT